MRRKQKRNGGVHGAGRGTYSNRQSCKKQNPAEAGLLLVAGIFL